MTYIWVADKDRNGDGLADNVELFASLRDGSWECDEENDANPNQCVEWDDNGAEGTGIYFGKDPKTLFVNRLINLLAGITAVSMVVVAVLASGAMIVRLM